MWFARNLGQDARRRDLNALCTVTSREMGELMLRAQLRTRPRPGESVWSQGTSSVVGRVAPVARAECVDRVSAGRNHTQQGFGGRALVADRVC